ncbi:MAG: hypothetical protein JOZ84_08780 [Methylobacteriaceae bacterium]|nr:hypothetical protein [Methylobacteriaceae bacterium]
MSDENFKSALGKAEYEPLLPIEKKLIAWSSGSRRDAARDSGSRHSAVPGVSDIADVPAAMANPVRTAEFAIARLQPCSSRCLGSKPIGSVHRDGSLRRRIDARVPTLTSPERTVIRPFVPLLASSQLTSEPVETPPVYGLLRLHVAPANALHGYP